MRWVCMTSTERFVYVSTECVCAALAGFDLPFIATRSHEAVVMIYCIECSPFLACHHSHDRYSYVYNIDQMSIYIDMDPATTLEFIGAWSVDVAQTTTANSFRASVFLCASAAGEKVRPLIVLAGVQGATVEAELWRDRGFDWEAAYYAVQRMSYCDAHVMQAWIDNVWRQQIMGPSVMQLDNLRAHRMEIIRITLERDCHTRVKFMPPGITRLSQPMDVSVVRPFKHRCRMLYLKLNRERGVAVTPRD
ncbi:hypothetical protein PybrP1_009282 [[Pythium] brassicae (nom. inval.)]|nr:hypothetical protein PybrP1_009282 [[Pythium] brassicae (nom. inval.)]